MYRNHFGLREKPFRVVPSPRFLFASETHDENRARVLYGIREDRGFVVVSGGIGLGKTTVLLSVLDSLGSATRTALIFNPVDDFHQLLRMICHEFDIEPEDLDDVELMRRLNLFLVERLSAGEKCVLIIDEAQNLPIEVLEKIRTLSNLQTEELSLLQIVLVGQPELREKLDEPRLVQLRQRVGVWHELVPLSAAETRSYIWHRLRLAGAPMAERIIVDDSCHRVHEISGGIPRLINQICDTALVIAYGRNSESVLVEDVEEAGYELQLLGRARRANDELDVDGAEELVPPEHPSLSRRYLWPVLATVVAAALVLVGSSRWDEWRGTERIGPAEAEVDVVPDSTVAPVSVDSPDATVPRSGEVPTGNLSAMGERQVSVDSMRRRGIPLYTVYLASFETEDEARDFAWALCTGSTTWTEPFFLETTAGQTAWYRVLTGGFPTRRRAQAWMRELRRSSDVNFAQLGRLSADAVAMEFATTEVARLEASHE